MRSVDCGPLGDEEADEDADEEAEEEADEEAGAGASLLPALEDRGVAGAPSAGVDGEGACGVSVAAVADDGGASGVGAAGASASAAQSLGGSSAGSAGGAVNGTRTGLAAVAPVMPLFGAFHDTTSSTRAP